MSKKQATTARANGGTAASAAPNRWILGPLPDLALFVATPLLILPLVHAARSAWTADQIYLLVASFGAVGHHLPGMMRAYGDKALFRRFRTRFIVAPIFLLAVCLPLAFVARPALLLIVFAWGVWHGFMQTHGFARIYDAKAGSTSRLTARLDQALLLSWFASVIAFSPVRTYWLVDHFLQAGASSVAWSVVDAVRWIVGGATVLVTLAWLAQGIRQTIAGRAPSPIKLLLQVGTIAFFAYANLFVADVLLAIILFELFHDVQYLGIVWHFNRRRVEMDPNVGGFTRFVFRPRTWLIGLYVGLVCAYGAFNIAAEVMPASMVKSLLVGVLTASGFLHFYYDGFIWKVRDDETRAPLAIRSEPREPHAVGRSTAHAWLPPGFAHATRWALLFVLPVTLLGLGSARGSLADEDRMLALAEAFPDDPGAQRNRAIVLRERGELDAAVTAARRAVALARAEGNDVVLPDAETALTTVLTERAEQAAREGNVQEAAPLLAEVAETDPEAIDRLVQEAVELGRSGDHARAIGIYSAVVEAVPDHALAHYNLAVSLAARGRLVEARRHAVRSAELSPGDRRMTTVVARIDAALTGARR